MADYKELLRRAISALPENNGAARRAVYEKARSALVGQLRAIQPPLPARDITQHRLQLEDCIRQVEQEASEAVINLGRDSNAFAPRPLTPRPAPPPPPVIVPEPEPVIPEPQWTPEPQPGPVFVAPEPEAEPIEAPQPEPVYEPEPEPVSEPEPVIETAPEPVALPVAPKSIEEIIAEAAQTSGAVVKPVTEETRPHLSLVDTTPAQPAAEEPRLPETPAPRPSFFSPRRETVFAPAAAPASVPDLTAARIEPNLGSTALARQPATEPVIIDPPLPVEQALSSVREVEVEGNEAHEAQGAIERAIETLDREARGEASEPLADRPPPRLVDTTPPAGEDTSFDAVGTKPRAGAGLTIFLVVFVLLLAGVGGAGFWAWREGYVDLDQMFGQGAPAVTETAQTTEQTSVPTLDSNNTTTNPSDGGGATGPGNTATTTTAEPTSALEADDRLVPDTVTPTGTETVLPSVGTGENKTEERLSGEDTTIAATDDPAASVNPVDLAGNQSLLLEASSDGQSGAVPFSGTVEWTEGTDEIGLPTLLGEASIPARNLDVSIVIRKNNDPILPASHLMEITFDVPDTFIGGSISTLAGVLLKNEELVPGTALNGAAARVVGNSFLFALSASPDDVTANSQLLQTRRWMDLAVIYGTGRNAILTLEKDEDAQALFDRVLTAWAE